MNYKGFDTAQKDIAKRRWLPTTPLGWISLTFILALMFSSGVYTAGPVLNRFFQTNLGLRRVEENNLVQPLNLSQTIDGITITVEQAYLDADRIVVEFTFVEPEGHRFDLQNIRLTLLPDIDLPATGVGGSDGGRYHLRFDASGVQGMPRQLDLQFVIYAEEWFYTPEIIELVEQYGSHQAIPPDKAPREIVDGRGDKIGPFIFDFKIPLENN